jgi:tetraacyldisaccharide 4'-kinase
VSARPWLVPLAALYGGAAALKAALYARGLLRRHVLRGPVVSVGNLRLGGTGKTPLVVRCAEILRDSGAPVAVLSRGYGGSHRGECLLVSDGTSVLATSLEAGDEPVMIARRVPGVVVAVGPRRDLVGRRVEERFGPLIHLLDDGFQHLRLARNLDLLCLGPGDLTDWPVPAGRLREFARASRRADLLFAPPDEPGVDPTRAVRLGHRVLGFFGRDGRAVPPPQRPYLLSGIASPERFHEDVARQVGTLAGLRAFPDHHPYRPEEIREIFEEASGRGADAVVTTAKDLTRLPEGGETLPLLTLEIAAEVEDEVRLRTALLALARGAAWGAA